MMQLIQRDSQEVVPRLVADGVQVDAIITDLPYGKTACQWDTIIPFDVLWGLVDKILAPGGVFITTATQPFSSALVMSRPSWYRHEWIWDKVRPSGFLNSKQKPMSVHEHVLIFGASGVTYNPVMTKRNRPVTGKLYGWSEVNGGNRDAMSRERKTYSYRYPQSIIEFIKPQQETKNRHPTQKPVAFIETPILAAVIALAEISLFAIAATVYVVFWIL